MRYSIPNWPPGFVSQIHTPEDEKRCAMVARCRETAQRNRKAGRGHGAGGGTLVMPGTPTHLPPGDMGCKR